MIEAVPDSSESDPLQCALDRGSAALSFINAPLVLDFMHMKFTSSLPSWTSRRPFHFNIPKEFFMYDMKKREITGELFSWDKLLRYTINRMP